MRLAAGVLDCRLGRGVRPLGLGWALVATAASGCVPIPAVLPPAKAVVSGGGAVGHDLAGAAQLRLGLHAGSFGEWSYDRPIDISIGLVHEATLGRRLIRGGAVDGPSLEFGVRIWRDRVKEHGMLRAFLVGAGEALTLDGDDWGGGFDVGALIEVASLSSRMITTVSDEGTVLVGWAHGETSAGLTLSAGWRTVAGEQYGVLLAGLSIRMPTLFGIFLVPIDP